MAKEAQQPYDNLLKRMLEGQPATIIPLLLNDNEIQVLEEVNVEVLIPPRRTDRVYKIYRKGKASILHFEFESTPNLSMDKRLLIYHALLYEKYHLPIISIIVYPFNPPALVSPLREIDIDGKEILTFHYTLLPLGTLDARKYLAERAVPLYGFVPAMGHTTENLLLQAFEEMVKYYENDDNRLRDEMLCFKILLERAQRLPEENLQRILRRIHMFDPLLEQDPWIKELRAQDKAKAYNAGIIEGELKSLRSILVNIASKRFPALSALAEATAIRVSKPEALAVLTEQILLAADENIARKALESQMPA